MTPAELPVVDATCDCSRCVERTTATYSLPGRCLNCGARFLVRNRMGDKAPYSVKCPACEVDGSGWRDRSGGAA